MDVFQAVLFFAFSATITPGPNNIMILSSGLNYGVRASLPHLFGICLGFPLMVLLVGLGFGLVFERWPALHYWIKLAGVLYLLYLAWKIGSASPTRIESGHARPFGFWQAAAFQWVNGKAWIMASGAVAAFISLQTQQPLGDLLQICAAFLLVAFPCVGLWLGFGAWLKQYLNQPLYRRLFNILMALLLVGSVLPVIQELVQELLS
ncbi:LysE family translocator [Rheinheimera sp.]|uniref:LysE family translocator n=1 Tax=Rheinheimera sp. TaxID=1869214 RepID=UPI00307F3AEC